MISRPRHRGAADRWRAAQESEEQSLLPAGFTRADALMSDAFTPVSRPATKASSKEFHMSENNGNTTTNANAEAADAGDKANGGSKRTLRDRANSAGSAIREGMQPSSLARFAKGFGKLAGTVAVAGLAIYGGVTAYKRYAPVS